MATVRTAVNSPVWYLNGRTQRRTVLVGAVLAIAFAGNLAHAQRERLYRVERVVDGDTLIVEAIGRVRLIGVDTPESVDRRKPVQPFALEASAFLRRLVGGRSVRLEYDVERFDRYKRTLAYVYLEDGTFVNEQIIVNGYGFAYTQFPFKYLERFRSLERQARAQNVGLWAK